MWRPDPTKKNGAIPKRQFNRKYLTFLTMKNILFVLILIFPLLGFCQSLVFRPDIKTVERLSLKDVELSIVFNDSRVYEKKLKEKCTKTEVFDEFVNSFERTYPNAKITVLEENKFEEDPLKGNITLKIDFKKYDVTFYTGTYIANTKYEVKIFDYRNEEKMITDTTIMGEGTQVNLLGYKSAKISSNSSFKQAFDSFATMLDKLELETIVHNDNN